MMGTMLSAVGSDAVAGGLTGHGAGIVSRHRLFERLAAPARVTVVSAPAGSGKTVLLRSWIDHADLTNGAAWVPVTRGEGDPQAFWLSALAELRGAGAGSALVQPLTAAPALDGWAIVERLLTDLAPLVEPLWLVVDDVHELGPDVLGQLELLIMRAPPTLRFVLAGRHDVRLGLHRLRLEGELAEVREADLRFTVAEAEELFADAGVQLESLNRLVERTEGWAAGLRLAALSLAGHPEPDRFAEEFSGGERTVAEYLLAEVLDRQPEAVRRLLLRTSILESVNGELADLLTGARGGERVLQDLEAANAFVVALGVNRSWFRYHRLFADLLQLELRRAEPDEVTRLHRQAADWLARHRRPVEAIRQAQAAEDWALATAMLTDEGPGLHLDGQASTIHELLSAFPAGLLSTDAELAAVAAADQLAHGTLEAAERYRDLAEQASASVPEPRSRRFRLRLAVVSLLLAGERANLPGVAEQAEQVAAMTEEVAQPGLGRDLRALALISLGTAEFWSAGVDAGRHLESGLTLARQVGRPYLEFTALAHQSALDHSESFARCVESATAAVELAERHGWSSEPAFGVACMVRAAVQMWHGQLDEAEAWVWRAERTLRAEAHPAPAMGIFTHRGWLELLSGRDTEALAAFQAADRLALSLVGPQYAVPTIRALVVHTMVRLGETVQADQVLVRLSPHDREQPEIRLAAADLRRAQADSHAALAELAPVLDRPTFTYQRAYLPMAYMLEAIALDMLGDLAAADSAIERALDAAEPDGNVGAFLLNPAPRLLERHARKRTAHPALIADILSLLAGRQLASQPAGSEPLLEPLSDSEIRVLRYLPTNLTGPEIARELYISINTLRSHMRHLHEKLGTHTRADTVARGRNLGLLAPSPHPVQATRTG
jgi:LuxR family maltose regulon positive regulatory protein